MRWYELLPELVLAVGLTAFLVDETDAATSAFGSGRAVLLMAVVAVAWLAARVLLGRGTRHAAIRTLLFAAAAAGILAVVVLPAYDDDTVAETLAVTAADGDAAATSPGPAPDVPAPPAEPVRIRTGSFRGVEHRASGTVAVYRRPDGSQVVGLEDFDIQPGPDYDLYLVPGAGRRDRSGGGIRIDDLRGNQGTQFSEVPGGIDLSTGPWTVLVWCQTFGVPVATATPV